MLYPLANEVPQVGKRDRAPRLVARNAIIRRMVAKQILLLRMIPLPAYRNRKTAVFGLGKAGRAAVESLLAGGAEVFAWDDKGAPEPGSWETAANPRLRILPDAEWPWGELAALALSPGVPFTHPAPHRVVTAARAAGCEVTGEVELLLRAQPEATAIGITGTNGKSTTTALIGHILSEAGCAPQVGGNLGTPALALEPSRLFVLEMSSYQLDLLGAGRFRIACLLNITPDHLDRHGGMEGYIAAKRRIFMNQRAEDTAIIGVDDAYSEALARELIAAGRRVIPVSVGRAVEKGVYALEGVVRDRSGIAAEAMIDLRDCRALRGAHNWQNAAMAYAACRALGVEAAIIQAAMRSFPGLAHRMEQIAEKNGVVFVNDSKATNADSAAHALGSYENIYWIAGGKPKAGGISTLGAFFPRIRHAFLIGEAEAEFADTLEGHVPYTRCGDLETATREAAAKARKAGGGVVLLSPACASFDQFANFEQRGEKFRECVADL